jgi:hypothetical protein
MKRAVIAIIAVIAIAAVSLFLSRGDSKPAPEGIPAPTAEVSNLVFKGEVVGVNAEQAKFDGPYLFAVKEAGGNEIIVSVPARGGRLCAAGANIAEPSSIQKGMKVEVSGALTFEGDIVPCESASHYLRVVSEK